MPLYPFECEECQHEFAIFRKMDDSPGESYECEECGKQAKRIWSSVHIDVFKPFVEENAGDEPVEFTSKRQRDEYLREHHLTYDTGRYVRKPRTSAAKNVTFEKVAEMIKSGDTEDYYEGNIDPSE